MKNPKKYKYLLTLTTPAIIVFTLFSEGLWAFFTPLYVFALVPLLELLFPWTGENLAPEEEEAIKKDPFFDYLLYFMVFCQYSFLILFLFQLEKASSWVTGLGYILTFGISCGVLGINTSHELGHRPHRGEQWLGQANLLTTLYMHFFIEHNFGHHKKVATPDDPASARMGETLYAFWPRTLVTGWLSAWDIEAKRSRREGPSASLLPWKNKMVLYLICETTLVGLVFFFFGLKVTGGFLLAALIGILLLETVNYIEHYGLARKKNQSGQYQKCLPIHSWNSEHVLGRLLLFELTRHADHHYNASRKYQILRYFEEGPQLPTGYPGMVLLSLFPPLWFKLMNPRVKGLARS